MFRGALIAVSSAGLSLGTGIFIEMDDEFLLWVDLETNEMNMTSVDTINVQVL
jgi:hypothetical protein